MEQNHSQQVVEEYITTTSPPKQQTRQQLHGDHCQPGSCDAETMRENREVTPERAPETVVNI